MRRAAPIAAADLSMIERCIVDLPWIAGPTGRSCGAKDSGRGARVPSAAAGRVLSRCSARYQVGAPGGDDASMRPPLRRPTLAASAALIALTMPVPVVAAADFPPA